MNTFCYTKEHNINYEHLCPLTWHIKWLHKNNQILQKPRLLPTEGHNVKYTSTEKIPILYPYLSCLKNYVLPINVVYIFNT